MPPPKILYSYLAAASLALVTLFTFYVYQDFGPQSAIRRFHMDVVKNDLRGLAELSLQDLNSPATVDMRRLVQRLATNNASYEVANLKRFHGEVLAAVEYQLPGRGPQAMVWHVVQTPNDWKIDCDATARELGISH